MQEKVQKFSPIKQRILLFADSLGVSKRTFYNTIGVSRGTLESPTGITEDILAKFIAAYPDVSLAWLILGEGLIHKSCEPDNSIIAKQAIYDLTMENTRLKNRIAELEDLVSPYRPSDNSQTRN